MLIIVCVPDQSACRSATRGIACTQAMINFG
jgi:hypothetical protein